MEATYYYVTCLGCAIDPDGKFREDHGKAQQFGTLAEATAFAVEQCPARVHEVYRSGLSDPHHYGREAARIDWDASNQPAVTYA